MKLGPRNTSSDSLELAIGKLVAAPKSQKEVGPSFSTPFDVKETKNELTVLIDLPGIDEDELRITVREDCIEIGADREFDHDSEDAEEYTHLGRFYGTFVCSVPVPSHADVESMTARYKRGVLKIRVPTRKA